MESKYGFNKLSTKEFCDWIAKYKIARTILAIQEHHTYSPNYSLFNGANHFELQRGMKNYHVHSNGWADIGQHFSIFPDGTVLTGRSLELSPACILGNNANAICIENVGNFDTGADKMNDSQAQAIVTITAALCKKFNFQVNTDRIVYHHWFNLSTGERNNGTKNNKTCPGSNFFGGNKVEDCLNNFIPKVKQEMDSSIQVVNTDLIRFVQVTAGSLNIRKKPNASSGKVPGREPALLGSILRVYEEKNGWIRISSSAQHWVSAKYTMDVERATVTSNGLKVRNGPGKSFLELHVLLKNAEVFVSAEKDGWCKIALNEQWVSKTYLKF